MKVFGLDTKARFKNSGEKLVSFQGEMIMPGEEKDISLLLLANPEKVARNYELGAELVGLVVGGELVKICDCAGKCASCPADKAPSAPVQPSEAKVEAVAPSEPEKAPEAAPEAVDAKQEVVKAATKRGK